MKLRRTTIKNFDLLFVFLIFFFLAILSSCEAFGCHSYIKSCEYADGQSFVITYGGETSCLTKECVYVTGILPDGNQIEYTINASLIKNLIGGSWTYSVTPGFASGETVTVKPVNVYWDCDLGHSHRLTGYKSFIVP